MLFRWIKIRELERGLYFHDRMFRGVLRPGRHFFVDPLLRVKVKVVSVRDPWLAHPDLDVIARSGALGDEARVLDLAQNERALVWIDGRLAAVCPPGLKVLWTVFGDVRVEVVDARSVRLDRKDLAFILESPLATQHLERVKVDAGYVGLEFVDGELGETLQPGAYAYWRGAAKVRVLHVDLREQAADISGQEIMTADKVSLRINALVTYRVVDPRAAVSASEDYQQALYRQAQLALREVVGTRELDTLLSDREAVAAELTGLLRQRVVSFGLKVAVLGIRDVILPGEMKELLNQVTEARKAAEAALITRREETAAMRSQANTARILESNPTLMRLRELEVLEKVAQDSQLSVVLGQSGLAEKVMKML